MKKTKKFLSVDDKTFELLGRKGYPPLLKKNKINAKHNKKLTKYIIGLGASSYIRNMHQLEVS